MNLSSRAYYDMTQIIMNVAKKVCDGKIISVLEGGYHLSALAESVGNHILALLKE